MKVLIIFIFPAILISCGQKSQVSKKFTSDQLTVDTLMNYEALHYVDRLGRDSIELTAIPVAIVEVPNSTKEIVTFAMTYVVDGNGYLTIQTSDGKTYRDLKIARDAVASTLSTLQNTHVRVDTTTLSGSLRFIAFKANPTTGEVKTLKAF